VSDTQVAYADVTNKAWLEWGQEILPHLVNHTPDEANDETEESLDKELEAKMDELAVSFLEDNSAMTKEEYDLRMKTIELEYAEKKKRLGGGTNKEPEASKDVGANAGSGAIDVDRWNEDEGSDGEKENDEVKVDEENEEGEEEGDEMSATMGTQGAKAAGQEKAGNEDAMEVDGGDNEGAKEKEKARPTKATATKTTKAVTILPPRGPKEISEEERAKIKARYRLMTPGRHNLRAVSGKVSRASYFIFSVTHRSFLSAIFARRRARSANTPRTRSCARGVPGWLRVATGTR
jgi:hypothetical protein